MTLRRALVEVSRYVPAIALTVLAVLKFYNGWQPRYTTPIVMFYAAAALEVVVAALLFVRRTSRIGGIAGCVLLTVFGIWAISSGRVGDCGCFADWLPATPSVSIRVAAALGSTCLVHCCLAASPGQSLSRV